jgi:hypothetical protein
VKFQVLSEGVHPTKRSLEFCHLTNAVRSSFRVKRVNLTVGWSLPVYSDQRTSSDHPGMSGWCQRTNPLSRERAAA